MMSMAVSLDAGRLQVLGTGWQHGGEEDRGAAWAAPGDTGALPCVKPTAQLSHSAAASADSFMPRRAPRTENQRLMAWPP
jgi:hypothetical protein